MLKSLLRIFILVAAIAVPLLVGCLWYWYSQRPAPGARIEAAPPRPWSDEKILELYR